MKKLYLDIDGVLLTTKNTRSAENADRFIRFILFHFECFWLTTHCKGNAGTALAYLSSYFDDEMMEMLRQIQPTNWSTLKTEGIDIESDFYWIDDYPFNAERLVLTSHRKEDRLIVCNLSDHKELDRIMYVLINSPQA